MQKRCKQAAISALSFIIPGLVMLLIYASLGFAPWGDKTILVVDMGSQYVDFFCALKNGDLFFSWSKVLGSGYIGVFSYYVSSPLSFLTLLVPNESMPVGLLFLTILKIALAGLSFSVFVQRRFPDCGISALICAVCYALTSYNAAYSMCIMWLDGVIWLPMILLALERILAGRNAGPFIAALTVCFFSTWYISYMVGIFCALYLCVRLVALKPAWKDLRQILVRFFGGAACALGLTAWMWLPTLLSMFQGKFDGVNSAVYYNLILCNPVLLVGQLMPGQYSGVDNSALPYVFCGTATVILAVAHFSFWEPYQREKLAERGALLLLALSIILAPLDRVWHLFQRPNWFPFRYAFLFSFFLLYLAVQTLPNFLKSLKKKRGLLVERTVALGLMVLIIAEMGLNAKGLISSFQERYGPTSYQAYQSYYAANAKLTAAAEADAEGGFYRMGSFDDRGLNTPLSFGYPGITHYSSFYNYKMNCLLSTLGLAQDWYWCFYRGSTPATDALLGVEYVISRGDISGYQRLTEEDGRFLWKNPDALPLAFLTEAGDVTLEGATPFERLNDLFSCLQGEDTALFIPAAAEVQSEDENTTFVLTGCGRPVYGELSRTGVTEISVNGAQKAVLRNDEASCVYCLGTPQAGDVWTVTARHAYGWTGNLWECDQTAIHTAVEALDKSDITSVDDSGRVELKVQTDEEQTLATTIPAENGWTAYVDGEQVEAKTWLDAFLALKLPAGEHTVELRYTAPGLIPGIVLGGVSLLGLMLAAVFSKRRTGGSASNGSSRISGGSQL